MVLGLHLAVFRPVPGQNAVELIADTYIDSLATPENREYTWVYYPVQPAIAVKRGDFLGMFYDRLETPQDMLSIVSKHSIEIGDKLPPTAVFLKDASDMLLNSLLTLILLKIFVFIIFTEVLFGSQSTQSKRIPALTAIVKSVDNVRVEVRPPTAAPTRPPTTPRPTMPTIVGPQPPATNALPQRLFKLVFFHQSCYLLISLVFFQCNRLPQPSNCSSNMRHTWLAFIFRLRPWNLPTILWLPFIFPQRQQLCH